MLVAVLALAAASPADAHRLTAAKAKRAALALGDGLADDFEAEIELAARVEEIRVDRCHPLGRASPRHRHRVRCAMRWRIIVLALDENGEPKEGERPRFRLCDWRVDVSLRPRSGKMRTTRRLLRCRDKGARARTPRPPAAQLVRRPIEPLAADLALRCVSVTETPLSA